MKLASIYIVIFHFMVISQATELILKNTLSSSISWFLWKM